MHEHKQWRETEKHMLAWWVKISKVSFDSTTWLSFLHIISLLQHRSQ